MSNPDKNPVKVSVFQEVAANRKAPAMFDPKKAKRLARMLEDEPRSYYPTDLLKEAAAMLREAAGIVEDGREAVGGLLAFIREKYPADFEKGGRGYICPHHIKLSKWMELSASSAAKESDD